MKEIAGRKFIDKQETARRLIHAAIRSSLEGECAISNHVVIGSALALMKEHAEKLGKSTEMMDTEAYAKPEFRDGLRDAIKSFYNFFKHANFDADMSIDVTNMTVFNDFQVFTAICGYQSIYGESTGHMTLFFAAMTILHPTIYDWETIATIAPQTEEARQGFAGWTREQLFDLLAEAARKGPAQEEASEDRDPLIDEGKMGHYDGPPSRDIFKLRL